MVRMIESKQDFDQTIATIAAGNRNRFHYSSDTVHIYSFIAGGGSWYLVPDNQGTWQGVIDAANEAMKQMGYSVQVVFDKVLTSDKFDSSMIGRMFTAKNEIVPELAHEPFSENDEQLVEVDEKEAEQLSLFELLGDV